MAWIVADRIQDSTSTAGAGQLTLANSAPQGFRTFGSVMSDNDICSYGIYNRSASEWEVGCGTYNATGTKFTRTVTWASSNAGSVVTFAGGTKSIFLTTPAHHVYAAGNTGATPAPNCMNGLIQTWTLEQNATWGVPTNPPAAGMKLILIVTQGPTGAFTTAWNAAYRNSVAWTAGATGTKASCVLLYDGTSWQTVGTSTIFA